MPQRLPQLLKELTPQGQAQVETLAAFILARRKLRQPQLLTNDLSGQERTELVASAGSFEWLEEEEDIYSPDDGEAVQWPSSCSIYVRAC